MSTPPNIEYTIANIVLVGHVSRRRGQPQPSHPQPLTDMPRLDQALAQVRATSPAVNFTIHFDPYQLYPDFPETTDKRSWHLNHKHNNNPAAQEAYQAHMRSLGAPDGISFSFDGPTGNTLQAHRVIQQVQETHGAEAADKLVNALYRRFFEEERHPAAEETLMEACVEAGVGEEDAKALVRDKEMGLRELKGRIREVGRDVDAVPVVVFEGKRRDLTLTGAKEVKDYVKAMETIIKESR